jgi:hypothetical protein
VAVWAAAGEWVRVVSEHGEQQGACCPVEVHIIGASEARAIACMTAVNPPAWPGGMPRFGVGEHGAHRITELAGVARSRGLAWPRGRSPQSRLFSWAGYPGDSLRRR